ncbi:MAG TPA: metallopeptidase family protein [Mycobacteriales bacterium]
MPAEEFEDEVARVLASLPRELSRRIKNVSFAVEDGEDMHLLGLYHGISLDRRDDSYAFALPDLITIYRLPILARCRSREDVLHEIEVTVKHEVGHYFGIDDARLHELGWG